MKKIFLILILLIWPFLVSAETVVLKTGEKLTGTIISNDDEYIRIDFRGTPVIYHTFEIDNIDGKPIIKQKKPAKGADEIAKLGVVSSKEYLERGLIYSNKAEFNLALANFNQAIKANPLYAQAYLQRALVYAALKKQDEAILDFNKAIEINPKDAESYYIRALFYARNGDFERANTDYTKVLEIKPDHIEAYLNRGFLNTNKGNFKPAEADFDKVVSLNPKVAEAYFFRGFVNFKQGDFDQAVSDYTKAIELNPKYAEAYLHRGITYVYRITQDKAKLDPNSPRSYINIGPTYAENITLEQGISDTTKAIEFKPDYADAYFNRARMYLFGKEYDLAWVDVAKLEALGANIDPQFLQELKEASGRDK